MIKTKAVIEKPITRGYPKLMSAEAYGLIILMTGVGVGTVIDTYPHAKITTHPVGYFSHEWVMANLKNYYGSVTLTTTSAGE